MEEQDGKKAEFAGLWEAYSAGGFVAYNQRAREVLENFDNYTHAQKLIFLRDLNLWNLAEINAFKKEAIEKFNPTTLTEKFDLFQYVTQSQNYVGNEASLQKLAQEIYPEIEQLSYAQQKFFHAHVARYSLTPDVAPMVVTLEKDKCVSKPDSSVVYLLDKKLGEGAFGEVWLAYEYNKETKQKGKKVAIKQFDLKKTRDDGGLLNSKESIAIEHQRLSKSFDVEAPIYKDENTAYLVMEYVPGKDLGVANTNGDLLRFQGGGYRYPVSEDVKKLSFAQKIELIWQMVLDLNGMHHNTVALHAKKRQKLEEESVVPAQVHMDIKLQNIHADIKDSKVRDVRLLDRGLTQEIKKDSPDAKVNLQSSAGSPYYISPEVVNDREAGTKSDLRSLVLVIFSILDVGKFFPENDFIARYEVGDIKLPEFPVLEEILKSFLKKMASFEFDKRPNTDEVLKFFTLLRNYVANAQQDDAKEQCEKILLSLNCFVNPASVLDKELQPLSDSPQDQLMLYKAFSEVSEENQLRLVKKMLENIESFSVQIQVELFSFVSGHAKAIGEKGWFAFAASMMKKLDSFSVEQFSTFWKAFNHVSISKEHREVYVAVRKQLEKKVGAYAKLEKLDFGTKLELFVVLSKARNHILQREPWEKLAKNLSKCHLDFNQSLQFLRCLNKHNTPETKTLRESVVQKINAAIVSKRKEKPVAKLHWYGMQKTALRKLDWGVNGRISFFAQRRLKAAINAEKNSALGKMVSKLTLSQAA